MKKQLVWALELIKVIIFLAIAAYILILGDRYHDMSENLRYFMAGALIVYVLYKVFWTHLYRRRYSD